MPGRKPPLIPLLAAVAGLLLSHRLVVWMGLAAGKESRGEARTSKAEARTSKEEGGGVGTLPLESKIQREQRAMIDELKRRALVRAEEENRRGGLLEYREANWAKVVAAEREKIPADADVKALVENAPTNAIGDEKVVAAFGVWLDRDATAALGWLAGTAGYEELGTLKVELSRWLGEGGRHAQLTALMDRYPAAEGILFESAEELAKQRGAEFSFALAKSLKDPEEQLEFISTALDDVDFVKAHLAELGPYLKGGLETRFLSALIGAGPAEEVEDAMRKAGLPEAMLLKYREKIEEAAHEVEGQMAEEEAFKRKLDQVMASRASEAPPSLELQVAGMAAEGSSWRSYTTDFKQRLPEFRTWCDEVSDGRMSGDEVLARVKEAWPESAAAGLEGKLRTLVFREIFREDPAASMQWYQEGGGDLEGLFGEDADGIAGEQVLKLMAAYPDVAELAGEDFGGKCRSSLASWKKIDPQGYAKASAGLRGQAGWSKFLPDEEAEGE
ncbi:hypothetical protein [Haloferula sp. BvORR071]|uniref:hypothetical protein n=1 Tax=Haloferula sp. BvORR071 TaxID=1396141 RepID=UPI000556371E|nr:hypothetical protein [Haloferula sp. BvORR071]